MSTARGILTKRLPRPGRGLFSLKAPVRIDPPAEERGFKPPVPPATESASPSEGATPREPIRVSKGSCNRRDQEFESLYPSPGSHEQVEPSGELTTRCKQNYSDG